MNRKTQLIVKMTYNKFFGTYFSSDDWSIDRNFEGIWEFLDGLCTTYGYPITFEENKVWIANAFSYMYGDRILNEPMDLDKLQYEQFDIAIAEKIRNRITAFVTILNREKYTTLIRTLADTMDVDKYNPLNNFRVDYEHEDTRTPNLTEKHTGSDTNTKTLDTTITDEMSYGKTDSGSIIHGEQITDSGSFKHGKTTTHTTTSDISTNSIFPYDSTTEHNESKNSHTENSSDRESGTDENGNTRTHSGTDTTRSTLSGKDTNKKTSGGTVTDALNRNTTISNTGNEKNEGTSKTRGYKPFSGSANIQAAVEAEYSIAPMSFVKTLLEDIADYILVPYYLVGENLYCDIY